jgi:hypothetical protein
MIRHAGLSTAKDLEFRVVVGVLDLPPVAPIHALRCVLELGQGLQALLELYDGSGALRLQIVRYRGGRSPAARIAERFRDASLNARAGAIEGGGWSYRLAIRNVSSLGPEGHRTLPWAIELDSSFDPDARLAERYPDGATLDEFLTGSTQDHRRTVAWGGIPWVPGDTHQHTVLSDGQSDPAGLIRENLEAGHGFLSITDHQILQPMRSVNGITILGGTEITTPKGHFLRLGVLPKAGILPDAPSAIFGDCDDLQRLCARFRLDGSVLVACHPRFPPWHWRCEPFSGFPFDAMEILCDPSHPEADVAANEALLLWTRLLDEGRHIVGIGGSDYHGEAKVPTAQEGRGRPGDPTTFLGCAESPTGTSLLASIRMGRVVVGRGFFPGLLAVWDRKVHLPGDTIDIDSTASGTEIALRVAIDPCSVDLSANQASIVGPGGREDRFDVEPDHPVERKLRLPDRTEGWFRLDVRDPSGHLVGFTNPVWWRRIRHGDDGMDGEAFGR